MDESKNRVVVSDNFTGRLALITRAAKTMGDLLAFQQATWEPHDWGDFS